MDESEAMSAPDPDHAPRGRRRLGRKGLVGAGLVAVIAFVGVGAFAEQVDEAKVTAADGPKVTTTTGEDTTTSSVPVVAPTDLPSTTTATTPTVFVPPPPAPPPTAAPETGSASISVLPIRTAPFSEVRWSSVGGTSWSITGPRLSANTPSGSRQMATRTGEVYTIVVRGSSGQVLAQQSATAP
jgi:hypothetical protein